MIVSVVVPTRNRAPLLARALGSLRRQARDANWEVLVIDNGSTDDTRQVAESYAMGIPSLRYVHEREPGLHAGRHRGLKESRGSVLAYIDDDVEVSPGWLAAIAGNFADRSVALLGGNNYPAFEGEAPAWLARLWARPQYQGKAISALSVLDFGERCFDIDPGYVWGCNFSIRKEVLLEAGGFHPDGMPEDMLRLRGDGETHVANHVRRSGLRAVFDSRASVAHLVSRDRMTREYFCRRSFAQGVSDSYSLVRSAGRALRRTHVLRHHARSVLSRLAGSMARLRFLDDPAETELRKVLGAAQVSYLAGFRFHMNEVRSDPGLLQWVLRERYL